MGGSNDSQEFTGLLGFLRRMQRIQKEAMIWMLREQISRFQEYAFSIRLNLVDVNCQTSGLETALTEYRALLAVRSCESYPAMPNATSTSDSNENLEERSLKQ